MSGPGTKIVLEVPTVEMFEGAAASGAAAQARVIKSYTAWLRQCPWAQCPENVPLSEVAAST